MLIGIDASRANTKQRTGVASYAFHIIQQLKTQLPEHIRVVLYSDTPLIGPLADLPAHWQSKVLRWPPRRLWTQLRLSWEMLRHPPDVLFVPAHVLPLIHPPRTVVTIHDVAAQRFPHSYSWFERWYTLWSARFALRKHASIIVPSQFTKRELAPFGSLDMIHVIAHGVDSRFCLQSEAEQAALRVRYGLKEPYLLSIGRLEEKKNTVRLVEAFDQLKQEREHEYTDLSLVLAGTPGYGYPAVQAAIGSARHREAIRELGWVDEADLPALLAGAELFVFPSLYEGFGLPLLEAMAVGTPIVTSPGVSLTEVAGEAAIYVDPLAVEAITRALRQGLSDTALRQTLRERGLTRVQAFSWAKAGAATAELLLSR